jgi:uncharacterized protein (DUF924 family)
MTTTLANTLDVLDFWYQGDATAWRRDPWFTKNPAFDDAIRDRFGPTVAAGQAGALDHWTADDQGTLALLLVLDQFARNIHRGSHLSFAGDERARRIVRRALADGIEARVTAVQRAFLYLVIEHSEAMVDQDVSVRLFESLPETEWKPRMVDFAWRHLVVIRDFGRYPHRNAALGRQNTPAEQVWLEAGGGF